MRLAYQLGWLSAYKFLQMNPQINHVDDVQFLKPVEIGSYLDLESKVAYVTDKFIHVVITCRNSKFTGEEDLTNVLRVTFEHSLGYQVRRVYPETLSDCYIYIESMRRVNKLMKA